MLLSSCLTTERLGFRVEGLELPERTRQGNKCGKHVPGHQNRDLPGQSVMLEAEMNQNEVWYAFCTLLAEVSNLFAKRLQKSTTCRNEAGILHAISHAKQAKHSAA